ncbi:hypothetical protein [Thiomonas sp. FB-6]|uniref:hypothetical protein n=1 Tax=Thiomonas sp. FB-6 TaxID=1158291 RepID=UPI000365C96F|nr:hypothetical protein [Thiomonas sp. FB-6]
MIDALRLLACGVCAAALAWGLWYWLGERLFGVLTITAIVYLLLENRRLRKSLRTQETVQTRRGTREP